MNILIEYLYRDAGNNKLWGYTVFSNKEKFHASELEKEIKSLLIDGEFFIAEDVRLPSLHFESYNPILDHEWHEYFSIQNTTEEPNDLFNRDITQFINALKLSKSRTCKYF